MIVVIVMVVMVVVVVVVIVVVIVVVFPVLIILDLVLIVSDGFRCCRRHCTWSHHKTLIFHCQRGDNLS